MTVYAITDTKKERTGIAPTYLQTTPKIITKLNVQHTCIGRNLVSDDSGSIVAVN